MEPLQREGESDRDYRIRLEEWRRENGTASGEEGAPDANGDGTISREELDSYYAGRGSPSRENAGAAADARAGYAYRDERTNRETGAYDPEGYRRSGGRGYGAEGGAGEGGGWGWGGAYGGMGGGGTDPNTWNDWSADIPVLRGLLGQSADEEAMRTDRSMALWNDLGNWAPAVDDLTARYEREAMIGPGADSLMARDALREWSEGGLTAADRAMMEDARRNTGRAARADREATMSAMNARGMGGSGAELAGLLSAGEGAADRNASMDATMMGAAQQRQIGATNALGEFGAREDDYARGRESRNTDIANREEDTRISAEETAYQNRERATAGATNQYMGANSGHPEDDDWLAGIGTAIDELTS